MKFGFVIPTGDIRTVGDLAHEIEEAGWDGAFYWDGIAVGVPVYDPWVVLAVMGMRTERVRLGLMLTPPSRRRPWKLAKEAASIDQLTNGRLILPVGLGALSDAVFASVGEPVDRVTRAELLDESLEIMTGLWTGEPFSYEGKHYQISDLQLLPPPVQTPRIPIWVAAAWKRPKSLRRALKYDGMLPNLSDAQSGEIVPRGPTPAEVAEMRAYVTEHRSADTPFDIVSEGMTPGDDPAAATAIVAPLAEAGATWWIESPWQEPNQPEDLRKRIRQGPPRLS
jgi:alkanesulfonate monooxygenase SsuD/methylene tetrahydromethanopterin reductase-like flavin-dependent oxidoreductase (luciferase family)